MPEAEKLLLRGCSDALDEAVAAVHEVVKPIDDLRSTREYRRAMSGVLLRHAWQAVAGGSRES